MAELPLRFYKSITSLWNQKRYQKVDGSAEGRENPRVANLGGGDGVKRQGRWKLRSIFRGKKRMPSPERLLAQARDAYIDSMVGVELKCTGLATHRGEKNLVDKRIPKARTDRPRRRDFKEFNRTMAFKHESGSPDYLYRD